MIKNNRGSIIRASMSAMMQGNGRNTARLMLIACALAPAMLLDVAAADHRGSMAALTRGLPSEVANFIFRLVECNHWAGEEPYDIERGRAIRQAVEKLRCDRIEKEERALRKRYSRHPGVLKALAEARKRSF